MSNYPIADRSVDRAWRDDPAKLIGIIRPSAARKANS
jgi:hypothetical protein